MPGAQSLEFVQYFRVLERTATVELRQDDEDPYGGGPGDCGDMDVKGPIGTPNTPAGWMILHSFKSLHNVSFVSRNIRVILFSW